jgi:Family of unknown function (DUF5302)
MSKSGSGKTGGQQGPSEDVKRKFREALDRKQAHTGRDVSEDHDHGKVEQSQQAASTATQQMFRRKSG